MIKEQACREKFTLLQPWVEQIFTLIKKEIRNDHLRRNPLFANKHFSKKPFDKITNDEIKNVYLNEILEGNEDLADWISSRWMLKNAEVYQFFSVYLSKINPNFEQIAEIPEIEAQSLMRASALQFGHTTTYIFSIINAVSFPESILQSLRSEALKEERLNAVEEKAETLEELKEKYEKEMAKITDRFEKRFAGMQKKYSDDIEGYKKQIKQLQRKLQDVGR